MTSPRLLGRFELISPLGRGGMGTVFLAKDPVIGRRVAIKEILVDPTGDPKEIDKQYGRFVLEFRSAGGLSHPNIVTIYDVGQVAGSYFIAMELVPGESLAAILRRLPRPPHERALAFARQIAEGLDHAHQQGVLHRDVKPANILVTGEDRVKLTDFGIAKLLGADVSRPATVVGTPGYMSPEQVRGHAVDGRSDQFALAVLLYQMLVGLPPYKGDSMSEVIYQLLHRMPTAPSECLPSLTTALDRTLLRGLAQNPAARYASCAELVAAVTDGLAGLTSSASARSRDPASDHDPGHGRASSLNKNLGGERKTRAMPELDGASTQPIDFREVAAESGTAGSTKRWQGRWRRHWPALSLAGLAGVVVLAWSLLTIRTPQGAVPSHGPGAEVAPRPTGSTEEQNTLPGGATGEIPDSDPEASSEASRRNPRPASIETSESRSAPTRVAGQADLLLRITSQPAGATLSIDGVPTGATTPTEISFGPRQVYRLSLQLAGHETVGWRFTLEELSAAQRADRNLHFPLRAAGERGMVTITADYGVVVRIGDRHFPAATVHQISLPAGRHVIELTARDLFLERRFPVILKAGERTSLRAPAAVAVRIAAQPGNCTVTVDGRSLPDAPPLALRLVAGQHVFVYTWPNGQRRRIAAKISRGGQRVFGTPP